MPKSKFKNDEQRKAVMAKMHDYRINETFMYPDGNADFESHHVDTIEATSFDEAEKKAIALLKLKKSQVSSIGADLGENKVGYEFETISHNAETGEKISESKADKLREKDEDLVSDVIHGFEIEKVD